MNRIHEEIKHTVMIPPASVTNGSKTGSFVKVDGHRDFLFAYMTDKVAAGAYLKGEVFEADSVGGSGSQAISSASAIFTNSSASAVDGTKVLVSMDGKELSKEYLALKITTDSASPVYLAAEMLERVRYGGDDVNSSADELLVV